MCATAQFFERPSQLPGSEQQDDLLFFVVHEAYQVPCGPLPVCRPAVQQ